MAIFNLLDLPYEYTIFTAHNILRPPAGEG